MLKLFYAPTSPYVRKVMVSAHLLGLADQINRLPSAAHPIRRDGDIAAFNPMAKVPTAMNDNGQVLFDSRVICEYLDAQAGGHRLFPTQDNRRWQALTWQSLGDGLLDAALLVRYEMTVRPTDFQWPEWSAAQQVKMSACLAAIEAIAGELDAAAPSIGEITIGCALGYLDFRFADRPWRSSCPAAAAWFAVFNATPAMSATQPHDQT